MNKTLLEKLFGYMTTQCLHTVIMLGIADHLVSGEKTSDELARLTNCQSDSLYRVLRCLASQDIFIEKDNKVFCLNEMSKLLIKNNPAGIAEITPQDVAQLPWGILCHLIQVVKDEIGRDWRAQ